MPIEIPARGSRRATNNPAADGIGILHPNCYRPAKPDRPRLSGARRTAAAVFIRGITAGLGHLQLPLRSTTLRCCILGDRAALDRSVLVPRRVSASHLLPRGLSGFVARDTNRSGSRL